LYLSRSVPSQVKVRSANTASSSINRCTIRPRECELSVPIVAFADGGVERFVRDVVEAAPMEGADLDRPAVSARDELDQKVACLLPVDDARKGVVLARNEDTAVDHDLHEKARLSLREPKRFDRAHALGGHAIKRAGGVGYRVGGHRNSSAARGSKGRPPLRLPPPLP
jgi:hypothetical protein